MNSLLQISKNKYCFITVERNNDKIIGKTCIHGGRGFVKHYTKYVFMSKILEDAEKYLKKRFDQVENEEQKKDLKWLIKSIEQKRKTLNNSEEKVRDENLKIAERSVEPGKILKTIRTNTGLSQKEFANRVGLIQGNLSEYESGKRNMNLKKFLEICKIIGVDDFNELLG